MTKKRTPMNAPDMLALLRDDPVERTAELLASVDDYRRADLGAVRVGAKPRSRKARGDRESLTDERRPPRPCIRSAAGLEDGFLGLGG